VELEVTAEVVLSQPTTRLPEATQPESFGFIITLGGESFSAAVMPSGSGHLVPGQPSEVMLNFLVPEAAAVAVRVGTDFTFFEQHRAGTGHVLTARTQRMTRRSTSPLRSLDGAKAPG
jgi:hypothetical protein